MYTIGRYNKFRLADVHRSPSNNPFFESHSIYAHIREKEEETRAAGTLHIDDLLYHNGLAHRVVR